MKPIVIAVLNEKGGSGKTTTTLNLARAFQVMGSKVVVIDNDPQKSATEWRSRCSQTDQAPTVVPLSNPLSRDDLTIFAGVDYIFIDGCPGLDVDPRLVLLHSLVNRVVDHPDVPADLKQELKTRLTTGLVRNDTATARNTAAIRLADFVLLPAKASGQDMAPTERMIDQLIMPTQEVKKLPAYGILLNQSKQANTRQEQKYRQELTDKRRVVLTHSINDREIYKAVYDAGSTIIDRESADTSAYADMMALAGELMGMLDEVKKIRGAK